VTCLLRYAKQRVLGSPRARISFNRPTNGDLSRHRFAKRARDERQQPIMLAMGRRIPFGSRHRGESDRSKNARDTNDIDHSRD
jgi:hypothetical protein